MEKAYIGLGSNIEPRKEYLDQSVKLLEASEGIQVTGISSIYETDPVDYLDQADFLNMVVEVETKLAPLQLLEACQQIETELGRKRLIDKGPRTIDLDILLYGMEKLDLEALNIPHPSLHERAFALVPLQELAPGAKHPGHNRTIHSLVEQLTEEDVRGVKQWDE